VRRGFFLALLALAACSQSGPDPNTFRAYLGEEPQNLDPAFAVDKASGTLVSLIYPALFRFDVNGKAEPDLVKSWTLGEDGCFYTFNLHKNRSFDDGSPADAYAAAACFRRLLDPAHPSPRRWVLSELVGAASFSSGESDELAGLSAPNDSTLLIRLDEPFSPFLGLLAMPAARIYPMDDEGLPARRGRLPVAGGPWRLAAWKRGDRFLLERRGDRPEGAFEFLSFRIIPQPFTAVAEFEVGNLDLLTLPQAEIGHWLSSDWAPSILRRDELSVSYLGLNTSQAPLNDLRVRQALNWAVDQDALLRTLRGASARASLGPVPPSLRGSAPAESYRYDPDRAKALLAEAGYPQGFQLEIWQKENPEVSRLLEAVQAYLAEVGVKVKIIVRDWGAFKDAVNSGRASAFVMDWLADYPDAENFLVPTFHSANRGGGGNRASFDDEYVDLLLDELSRLPEGKSRDELVDRLNEVIYSKAPWIWLWHPVSLQVLRPGITGYQPPLIFNGQDYLELRHADSHRP
jgi:oligopeptide transport system substrate-binding protein